MPRRVPGGSRRAEQAARARVHATSLTGPCRRPGCGAHTCWRRVLLGRAGGSSQTRAVPQIHVGDPRQSWSCVSCQHMASMPLSSRRFPITSDFRPRSSRSHAFRTTGVRRQMGHYCHLWSRPFRRPPSATAYGTPSMMPATTRHGRNCVDRLSMSSSTRKSRRNQTRPGPRGEAAIGPPRAKSCSSESDPFVSDHLGERAATACSFVSSPGGRSVVSPSRCHTSPCIRCSCSPVGWAIQQRSMVLNALLAARPDWQS